MNNKSRERVEHIIAVQTAWKEGKEIEQSLKGKEEWRDKTAPFDWAVYDYRVKQRKVIAPALAESLTPRLDSVVENVMRQMVERENAIIANAFFKHFGFSINEIPLYEIERIIQDDSPLIAFRFHDETFLYMEQDWKYDTSEEGKITWTRQHFEV